MAVSISVQIDHDPSISIASEAVIINTQTEPSEDEYYHGDSGSEEEDYTVNPTFSDQVLPTRGKRMKRDLTVSAVPYIEVDNGSGGRTVTIMG